MPQRPSSDAAQSQSTAAGSLATPSGSTATYSLAESELEPWDAGDGGGAESPARAESPAGPRLRSSLDSGDGQRQLLEFGGAAAADAGASDESHFLRLVKQSADEVGGSSACQGGAFAKQDPVHYCESGHVVRFAACL